MSWDLLEPLVRSLPLQLRDAVRRVVETTDERQRREFTKKLVELLGGTAPSLAMSLARSRTVAGRRMALDLVSRMKRVNDSVRVVSYPLLPNRDIPLSSRLAATRAMLRGLTKHPADAAQLLRYFVAGLGRSRAIHRLDALAPRLTRAGAALATVRAELLDRQRMRCPRCGVSRRRKRMADHLWKRHQLLLDGRRAQTPWQALDARLDSPDPIAALGEMHRTILRRGFLDEESLTQLLAEAAERHESLCPECFVSVPTGEAPTLTPLPAAPGRVAGAGVAVTVSRHNVRPRLRVEAGDKLLTDAVLLNGGWTSFALSLAAAITAIAAAAAAAVIPTPWHVWTTIGLLGMTVLLRSAARRAEVSEAGHLDLAIDAAWHHLVPSLGPSRAVSRLALASVGHGDPEARAAELNRTLDATSAAVLACAIPPTLLAPLWWLRANDDRAIGRDPLPELVQRLAECFRGQAPLSCAADLLTFAQQGLASRGDRARLRVLGCGQAFAAGLGVWDLCEIGRAFPAIAVGLELYDVDQLARLRILWEERGQRPWRTCGPASTVFDLARYPVLGKQTLAEAPDLLLYQPPAPVGPNDEPSPIMMCGRGLIFHGELIRELPEYVWVVERPEWQGGGYELRVEPHRFHYHGDPTPLVDRLRRWADFGLGEFPKRVAQVQRYRAGEQLDGLLTPRAMGCPNCGTHVIPAAGRLAMRR